MNFVAECTTTFAPHSKGLSRYGVASVLSTISGTPGRRRVATASTSSTSTLGLPIDSAKKALVLGRGGRKFSADFAGSTRVTSMPNFGNVWTKALYVPP